MGYFKTYFKLMAYMISGIVFAFSSFYLFINIFHSIEISKKINFDAENSSVVQDYYNSIANIEKNISGFDANRFVSNGVSPGKMLVIKENLNQCANIMKNTYLDDLKGKDKISIQDVYELRNSYENKILSECIVNNLYWVTSLKENNVNSSKLLSSQEVLIMYVNSLKNETSYLKKDLLNNSSYYFNTSTASSGVKDNVRDGLFETLSAYKNASSFVEYVSNWFKNEVGGM